MEKVHCKNLPLKRMEKALNFHICMEILYRLLYLKWSGGGATIKKTNLHSRQNLNDFFFFSLKIFN